MNSKSGLGAVNAIVKTRFTGQDVENSCEFERYISSVIFELHVPRIAFPLDCPFEIARSHEYEIVSCFYFNLHIHDGRGYGVR